MKPYFYLLIFVSFLLNLLWENSHGALYITDKQWMQNLAYIPCSLGDIMLVLICYAGISIFLNNWNWGIEANTKQLVYLFLFSAFVAFVAEKIAIDMAWWQYNREMPQIPIFEIGLSPWLQIAITPTLSVISAKMLNKQKRVWKK